MREPSINTLNRCKTFLQSVVWSKVLVGLILFSVLLTLFVYIPKFSAPYKEYSKDPLVFDFDQYITDSQITFEIPKCPKDSPECYVANEFDASHWQPMQISKDDFRKKPGYDSKGGNLLYRFRFKIPERLFDSQTPISISLVTGSFEKVQYYLNGKLIAENEQSHEKDFVALISTPRTLLSRGTPNTLTIAAKYKSSNIGFFHSGQNLIGPKNILEGEYISLDREYNSYYLLIMLMKMGILSVIAILFLFSETQPFLKYFLIYGFLVSTDVFFATDYAANLFEFNTRAFLFFNFQFFGFAFLWRLVEALLEFKSIIQRSIAAIFILIVNILFALYLSQILVTDIPLLRNIAFIFFIETLIFTISTLLMLFIRKKQTSVADIPIPILISLFSAYMIIALFFQFQPYFYNNKRHLIDIIFFIGIAYVTFKEFTVNKIKLAESQKLLKAQENDVELGKASSRIAHDLRKPFKNLRMALSVLDSKNIEKPDFINMVNSQLFESIDYAEEMIEDILNVKRSKILNLAPIDLSDLVGTFDSMFFINLRQRDIDLEVSQKTKGTLLIDKTKLISVIQNILSNAEDILASQNHKRLWLRVEKIETSLGLKRCRFSIGNNGPPIPESVLAKLFSEEISHGKSNGTGIGLMGVKQIIDLHGGSVRVRNLSFNKGVEFEFDLDFYEKNQVLPSRESESSAKIESHPLPVRAEVKLISKLDKIALIDDDDLIQMAWKMIWPKEKLSVFSTPEEFLSSIETSQTNLNDFDLVITDLFFGKKSETSGVQLAQSLVSKNYFSTVLCSGTDDTCITQQEKALFLSILDKQIFNSQDLLARISNEL